ncbi:MAG: hypothetical protein ACKOSS_12415 [Planctomycetia bacterium]
MFENLKQAQQSGMTQRERRRFAAMLASMLVLGGAIVGMRSCDRLPGRKELPQAAQRPEEAPLRAALDRARLEGLVRDDEAGRQAFQPQALEQLRTLLGQGLAEAPVTVEPASLAREPWPQALGRHVEVEGRITALSRSEYRSELETLWALVLEGKEGGQVVVVRVGSSNEPGSGAPADAWPLAPVELQVGDRALVRGVVAQRRTGTLGQVALAEPTPVVLASHFRRQVDPPADPIADPTEAAFDKVDDRFFAGTARMDDPVIFELLQWLQLKGHAWVRAQLDSGALPVREWERDAFDRWSEEAGLRTAEAPRPWTTDARGKAWRTSGLVGRVLRDDWDGVRPNRWGVNQLQHLYLWSDWYGNNVIPCLSPFAWEEFGCEDWRKLDQRVWVYGIFVKNYTFDRSQGSAEGGYAKLTMPLFIVLDVQPYPVGKGGGAGVVALVLLGMVVLGGLGWWMLRRNERREVQAWRERQQSWRRGGGARAGTGAGTAATEPAPGASPGERAPGTPPGGTQPEGRVPGPDA